jgi:aldose 1-epimerase
MSFFVRTKEVAAGGRADTAIEMGDDAGTVRAEVWPGFGFNCLQWQVKRLDGIWGDILYKSPEWETNPVPTRSGHPILFPFPNRLKHGKFTFEGTEYQLPLNESSGAHAIHGFTPRVPWGVTGSGTTPDHAWVTGELQLSADLPHAVPFWPADFIISVSYRLSATALIAIATVVNPTETPLPFGLGYHPYFCHPNAPGAAADELVLTAAVEAVWESDGGLPTGKRVPVPADLDFRTPRPIGPTPLDTLFRLLPREGDNPTPVARLSHPTAAGEISVWAPPEFGELLLFTPPHRKAVAIEPYTCTPDAANLQAAGIDAGWRVLPPDGQFVSAVGYRWKA